MDARTMGKSAIHSGILRGNYEITGVTETGELVIALITDADKKVLEAIILNTEATNEQKQQGIKTLMSAKGRPAEELMQVYKQRTDVSAARCTKNGLRLR